ncbi:MAG: COR domain-containing protein [Blastocatellia bacterium]
MSYQDAIRIVESAIKSKREQLQLTGMELPKVPANIERLGKLRELHLSHNNITQLPPWIGRFAELRTFDVSGNLLNDLPPEFTRLINLHTLYLAVNQFEELPAEICSLTGLDRLRLSGNRLSRLPAEIANLVGLEELHLRSNRLAALPPEIGKLNHLQLLNVRNNNLRSLPPEIGQLNKLERLDLGKNQLKSLPPELGNLPHLKELILEGNPLQSPPPEIVKQGTAAVLAYLRELRASTRQWVSKLLLVGEGGVGKTSLLRALRGEGFDFQESTTHGIEIGSLGLQHPTESKVKLQLNTWDFGGQVIYHATHQFFLTNRSLYIVVWNTRTGFEQGKLYYWLDTIQARAPESPVIIVATHTDEREANIPLAELKQKYPQVIAHFAVSNKESTGIEELRRAITDAAASLPLMGEMWPAAWLAAANAIRARARRENYLMPSQLFALMREHKVARDEADVLSRWLHELGEILYFSEDEELNDIVILNPQWVTEGISRVLDSEEVIANHGLFTRKHMDRLWGDLDPGMRDHFLRLMEKFDLSYRTREDRDISLIVERLTFDPPQFGTEWDRMLERGPCAEISMKFEMASTMPAGVPTWFIARVHRFTTRTHWRFGGLFADGPDRRHMGLVQAFPHDRYLSLTVRGPAPQNFFALLRDGLEYTLQRFPGLRIERKVPCPGHDGEACSHEFDLQHLERAVERKTPILEIQCPVSFENVSVPQLLFGMHMSLRDEVLDVQRQTLSRLEKVELAMNEMSEMAQREFTKLFNREQSRLESFCPNIFILRPSTKEKQIIGLMEPVRAGAPLKTVLHEKLELQLYCQAPGCWHPTGFGRGVSDPRTGIYQIDNPTEFLKAVAPYIKKMFKALKFAAPIFGVWTGTISKDDYEDYFKGNIRMMSRVTNDLPESDEERELQMSGKIGPSEEFERASGAALRELRHLLDEKDKRQIWGGLKRILTKEGHYLWLCRHHAMEYRD